MRAKSQVFFVWIKIFMNGIKSQIVYGFYWVKNQNAGILLKTLKHFKRYSVGAQFVSLLVENPNVERRKEPVLLNNQVLSRKLLDLVGETFWGEHQHWRLSYNSEYFQNLYKVKTEYEETENKNIGEKNYNSWTEILKMF